MHDLQPLPRVTTVCTDCSQLPPTVPFAGPCCRATGIGPSCSQKSPVAASYFRRGRGKDPARRRNLMHELKSAFAACGLALLAAIPAAAEDLTIALGYPRTADRWGQGVTTLFISPNDVRYRTRNYYEGNKDWVFNVASGRLVMIDHDGKQYAESDAEGARRSVGSSGRKQKRGACRVCTTEKSRYK